LLKNVKVFQRTTDMCFGFMMKEVMMKRLKQVFVFKEGHMRTIDIEANEMVLFVIEELDGSKRVQWIPFPQILDALDRSNDSGSAQNDKMHQNRQKHLYTPKSETFSLRKALLLSARAFESGRWSTGVKIDPLKVALKARQRVESNPDLFKKLQAEDPVFGEKITRMIRAV
jgi:hypothetical protein